MVRFLARARDSSLLQSVKTGFTLRPNPYIQRVLELLTHHNLVPWLRMSAAIPETPYTFMTHTEATLSSTFTSRHMPYPSTQFVGKGLGRVCQHVDGVFQYQCLTNKYVVETTWQIFFSEPGTAHHYYRICQIHQSRCFTVWSYQSTNAKYLTWPAGNL